MIDGDAGHDAGTMPSCAAAELTAWSPCSPRLLALQQRLLLCHLQVAAAAPALAQSQGLRCRHVGVGGHDSRVRGCESETYRRNTQVVREYVYKNRRGGSGMPHCSGANAAGSSKLVCCA